VQYTRARHLTQPPTANDGHANTAGERAAEPGAAASRLRETRWDVRERRRRPDADPGRDVIDLTEQSQPGSPVSIVADAPVASTSSSASGRSSSPQPGSLAALRQRPREADSADKPERSERLDADRSRRRSSRSSPSRRRGTSPDQHRRRRKRRRSARRRSRSRTPTRLPAEGTVLHGRRSSEAEQRKARSSTDVRRADQASRPPVGRDVGRFEHDDAAVHEHDLAAAELRRLRQRALQGTPSARPEANPMHGPGDDDRWAME